jgi:phosphotransferase system IIA component
MLPLLAAAWAVGTAKLIAEKTHAIAIAATAGDPIFLFVKYDTLPP